MGQIGHQLVLALLGGVSGALVGQRLRADNRQLVAGDGQVGRQLDGGVLVGEQASHSPGQLVEVAQRPVQGSQDDGEPAGHEDEQGQRELERLDERVGGDIAYAVDAVLAVLDLPDRVLVGDAQRPRLLGGGQVEPGAVGLLLGLAKGALQKVVQRRLVVAQDGGADEDSRGRIHRGLRRHERLGLGQREPQLLQGRRHAQGRYGLGGARVVSGNGLGGQNGLIGKEGNGPGVVGLGIEGGRVVDEGARVADGRGVGARGDGHIRPELFGPLLGVGRGSLGVLG